MMKKPLFHICRTEVLMRTLYIVSISLVFSTLGVAQDTVTALFLGNSYTHRNSMPTLVDAFAKSTGDRMLYKDNTPGGFTLSDHLSNTTTTDLIKSKKWDFVVLQEQSQLPSFPDADVQNWVYPAAKGLTGLIKANDSCTDVVFYRTWGRKNGDSKNCPFWPPVCTYEGMDSLLALRYQTMADNNGGLVSPVGEVWQKMRTHYPSVELYKADESHPSEIGSYAAACCFYTLFFRKDPTLNSYKYSLNDSTANRIKRFTKQVVFNHFDRWNVGQKDPDVAFEVVSNEEGLVQFKSTSSNVTALKWNFGDKTTSSVADTAHQYDSSGTYTVKLIGMGCQVNDTAIQTVTVKVSNVGISQPKEQAKVLRSNEGFQVYKEGHFLLKAWGLDGKMLFTGNYSEVAVIRLSQVPNVFILEVSSDTCIERSLQAK